jgi:two-component system, cell cycle response regulator
LLLPETDLESALLVAERLRLRIAKHSIADGKSQVAVTASIGVANASPTTAGIVELMKRADQALYAAKRGGRNQIVPTAKLNGPTVVPLRVA